MKRRRKTPWIYHWARPIIGAIAALGALGTGYLTIVKLMGGSAACPTSSCDQVLSSPYATVFGLPLTLFGFLGYAAMGLMAVVPLAISKDKNPELRLKLENLTWLLLFVGATALVVFSGYLMYLLAFVLKTPCLYCIASATFTVAMFLLTLLGHDWQDTGQLFFTGIIVAVVVLTGTLGVYANVNNPSIGTNPGSTQQAGPAVTTTSGPDEIALARHLSAVGAKMYGAWWCPHCYDQKQLFGKAAVQEMTYIECASPDDPYRQIQACQTAGIQSYPTWEINGEQLSGVKTLDELADLSGYTGSRNFKN